MQILRMRQENVVRFIVKIAVDVVGRVLRVQKMVGFVNQIGRNVERIVVSVLKRTVERNRVVVVDERNVAVDQERIIDTQMRVRRDQNRKSSVLVMNLLLLKKLLLCKLVFINFDFFIKLRTINNGGGHRNFFLQIVQKFDVKVFFINHFHV